MQLEQLDKPIVKLATEKELRIFMFPLRQKILRTMHLLGEPTTAKHIADTLGISPSSARHHLIRLQEIGLVEHDHYEMVNGIKADFIRVADVTVSIGTDTADSLIEEREALSASILANVFANFTSTMHARRENPAEKSSRFQGDLFSGIAHLDAGEAEELHHLVRAYLEDHAKPTHGGSSPWEFAFLLYETTR